MAVRNPSLAEKEFGKAVFVVHHDVYFIAMVDDDLLVFSGQPGIHDVAGGPPAGVNASDVRDPPSRITRCS